MEKTLKPNPQEMKSQMTKLEKEKLDNKKQNKKIVIKKMRVKIEIKNKIEEKIIFQFKG
jgi:hypothetical protein